MTYESTYFLPALADIKEYLGITSGDVASDGVLCSIATVVTYWMERYTGRKLKSRSLTEIYNGNGRDVLYTKNYPITSSASEIAVYVDDDGVFGADTKINATSLRIDGDNGVIHLIDDVFSEGVQNVKVVYTGGYGAGTTLVPFDLVGACFEFIGFLWKRKTGKQWELTGLNVTQGGVTFLDEWAPKTVRHVLDGYRSHRRGL
ncbi:fasciclin domain-containing protein [Candidatus Pacearchaeota archaeon]|jgi:hypothetical protein|nr:fasciclin domain-containing protein [Candidatus Pacearchaeota archaeon]